MGEEVKTYRFNFVAVLGLFQLNTANISSPLHVTWKRSSESASTTPVDMVAGKAHINQTLTLPTNMYFDTAKQLFQDKKSVFTFTMSTPKGQKQAGVVYVQLAQILNNKLEVLSENFLLEKCPVKESKVQIAIRAEFQGERNHDGMSIASDIPSSGPSTLSIQSRSHIPSQKQVHKRQEVREQEPKRGKENARVAELEKQVQGLIKQKEQLKKNRDDKVRQNQELKKELSLLRVGEGDSQSKLREELSKSKASQQKLQRQLGTLKSENSEHERELQKMRLRMEQIYELLFSNLNSLY